MQDIELEGIVETLKMSLSLVSEKNSLVLAELG